MNKNKNTHKLLRDGKFQKDEVNNGIYKQEIGVNNKTFDKLNKLILKEINEGFPTVKQYEKSYPQYLKPLVLSGHKKNVVFLNDTTKKFINTILKMKLKDVNTYILVRERPKNVFSTERFISEFAPIQNKFKDEDTILFDIGGYELKYIKKFAKKNPHLVWTLIDGYFGEVITSGFHIKDRLKYVITKNKWIDSTNVVFYDDFN